MTTPLRWSTPQDGDSFWLAALQARDASAADAVLHEDYALVLVQPAPARMERAEWLGTLDGYVVEHFEDLRSVWDVSDDVAVHLHLVDMRATVFGTDRSGLFAISDTWLRTDRGWQVWIRHSTPMSAGALPRKTSS